MKTRFFSFLILVVTVIGMNGCSKGSSYMAGSNNPGTGNPSGGSASPGVNEVWMQNTAFNPSSKTIMAGTTITWTNKDATSHDVTSLTGAFTSLTMDQGATFSFTFTTAGTYNYSCTFHPGMTGTIIVQ